MFFNTANLSIRYKGYILISIPIIFQVFLIVIGIKVHLEEENAQKWTLHSKDVIAKTEKSLRNLLEASGSMRGYILTHNESFKNDFLVADGRLVAGFSDLEKMVIDNELQQKKLYYIVSLIQSFREELSSLVKLKEEGDSEASFKRVLELIPKKQLDVISEKINDFVTSEEQLYNFRKQNLKDANKNAFVIILLGIVSSMAIMIFMGRTFGQSIVSRIEHLIINVDKFSKGEKYDDQIVLANDEVSKLDKAFKSLTQTLTLRTQENEMFIYSVSHDLRSPLVNVQGFSKELSLCLDEINDILQKPTPNKNDIERIKHILSEDTPECISFIKTAVERLAAIIDALLKLSRLGKIQYDFQILDLNTIIRRIIGALNNSIEEKKIQVFTQNLPSVYGDQTAIEQVFANLITNATQYIHPERSGTIEIGVKWEFSTPDEYTIFVKDNGLGIPTEYREKLFKAFQRFHPEIKGGEGIGLTVVKRIVERHGGRLWIDPDVKIGSIFYVTLSSIPNDASISRSESL